MADKTPASSGLVVGGLSGADDELLEDGQEEVFSRAEVEGGRIEHDVKAGGDSGVPGDGARRPPASGHGSN